MAVVFTQRVPYRRLALTAEWSLLAVVVMLHLAGWFWNGSLAAAGPLGQLVADSLPMASLLILATWCVLGPGYAWSRGIVAAALVLASMAAVLNMWQETHSRAHSHKLLSLALLATFVCAGAVRLTGLRTRDGLTAASQGRGVTFTIFGLLTATTAIAYIIGGLEAMRPWLLQSLADDEIRLTIREVSGLEPFQIGATVTASTSTPWDIAVARMEEARRNGQFRLALATALFTALTLLAYAAALRPGAAWLRLAGLTAVVPAAGWYIGHLTETSYESTVTLILWAATTTSIFTGSLVPLRLMGFRLLRPLPPPAKVQL